MNGLNRIECMWYLAVFHFHAGYWIFGFLDFVFLFSLIFRAVAILCGIKRIHIVNTSFTQAYFLSIKSNIHFPPGRCSESCIHWIFEQIEDSDRWKPCELQIIKQRKSTNWITATAKRRKKRENNNKNNQMETNSFNGIVSSFRFVHETSEEIENNNKISLDGWVCKYVVCSYNFNFFRILYFLCDWNGCELKWEKNEQNANVRMIRANAKAFIFILYLETFRWALRSW